MSRATVTATHQVVAGRRRSARVPLWPGRWAALGPGVLFVALCASVAQLLFGALGFNPTDEGFILAYSRRLLDGQVPHRDFISIRPVGSALLHAPVVALGGDAVFWLDRFLVWGEWAALAWLWVAVLARALDWSPPRLTRIGVALVTLAFGVHTFPLMAWHTVDGLFLAVCGLALAVRPGQGAKLAGYVLIGAAVLCKQNFAPVAPACVLLLGDGRGTRYWGAALLPAGAYAVWLAAAGALPDAVAQLGAQAGLVQAGVRPYLQGTVLGGLLLGLLLEALAVWRPRVAALGGVLVLEGLALGLADGSYYGTGAFVLFGLAAGAVLGPLLRREARGARRAGQTGRWGALGLLLAWCASISLGYNSPALAGGLLAAFLLLHLACRAPWTVLGALAALVLLLCGVGRWQHVYGDRPAAGLTASLAGVFPGGRFLRTNPTTAAVLRDLVAQERRVRRAGLAYAIVPDCAACWVASAQANPLPIDWPVPTELATPALARRETAALLRQRGHVVVLVLRVDVAHLAAGPRPLDARLYPVVSCVRRSYRLVARSAFVDLYR